MNTSTSRRSAQIAALCLCLAVALPLSAGCSYRRGLRGMFARKPVTMPGVTTPSEYMQELREVAGAAGKESEAKQEEIAQQLANGLKAEKDSLLRMQVLQTFGSLKCPTATNMLRLGLKDPDADVRVTCCDAWREQGGPEAVDLLVEAATSDSDRDVRMAAARCLGELKDRRGVAALGQMLEDRDPAMQYRAVASLKEITGQDLGNDVNAWSEYVKQGAPERPVSWASRLTSRWR